MSLVANGVSQLDADKLTTLSGVGAIVIATVAGNVNLVLHDGSSIPYPVAVGVTKIDGLAVRGFKATGTTATATVYQMRL